MYSGRTAESGAVATSKLFGAAAQRQIGFAVVYG